MPLIGGNKYSCEPCIRGHRATHCQHTDRILIEVRKPGRPLDRCAHSISSCTCPRHIKNSTVIEVKVKKERELSLSLSLSPDERNKEKGQGKGKGESDVKRLLISREQPFARELRLSSVPSSTSSTSSEDDEEEGLKGYGTTERRKGNSRVFKRHRLSNASPSSSATSGSRSGKPKNVENPLFAPTTSSTSMTKISVPPRLNVGVEMEVDDELPSLSPSISESGSDRTVNTTASSASERRQQEHEWNQRMREDMAIGSVKNGRSDAGVVDVYRSISIQELLT